MLLLVKLQLPPMTSPRRNRYRRPALPLGAGALHERRRGRPAPRPRIGRPGRPVRPSERVARPVPAVWDGKRECYSDFQRDARDQLHPSLVDLLTVLPHERDGRLDADAVLWVCPPDDVLDGCEPATLIRDRTRARDHFGAPSPRRRGRRRLSR